MTNFANERLLTYGVQPFTSLFFAAFSMLQLYIHKDSVGPRRPKSAFVYITLKLNITSDISVLLCMYLFAEQELGPTTRPISEESKIKSRQAYYGHQVSTRDDIIYEAKSGYVLVINNNIFPSREDVERTGFNDDVRNLTSLFDDFNFRTRVHDNLTKSEMLNLFTDTAEKDFSRFDCFVCVILSHGSNNEIYGTDDEVIKIEAITKLFRRDECTSLEGKPKIFLIQACRGQRRDRVPIESDSDTISFSSSSLPADSLICFASAPGHQSYRHPLLGSWFISSVIDVFKEYADREHIMDMMLRVNNRVAGFFSKEGLKQMPCQVCMLTKKVFFDPKYSRT